MGGVRLRQVSVSEGSNVYENAEMVKCAFVNILTHRCGQVTNAKYANVTQTVYCVFFRIKTETFENALV